MVGEHGRVMTINYPADDYTPGRSDGNNLPLRGAKTQLDEGGIRVAAFIHWPGRLPADIFTESLHVVDWMPTLCALAECWAEDDLK